MSRAGLTRQVRSDRQPTCPGWPPRVPRTSLRRPAMALALLPGGILVDLPDAARLEYAFRVMMR